MINLLLCLEILMANLASHNKSNKNLPSEVFFLKFKLWKELLAFTVMSYLKFQAPIKILA